MLDTLLVLGQVPGTKIQITYYELVIVFMIVSAIYEYKLRRQGIHRRCKWAWYRVCINYRRRKRILRTFIKTKRYRLAVFERRIIRGIKTYFRRRRRAAILKALRTNRLIRKSIRKAYLYCLGQTYGRCVRSLKAAQRWILRRKRLIIQAVCRRYSLIKRAYYVKQVQIERIKRRVKRSRTVQTIRNLKNFVHQAI